MSYDPKVYALVKHFLEAVPEKKHQTQPAAARPTSPGRAGGLDPVHAVARRQGGSVMLAGLPAAVAVSQTLPGFWSQNPRGNGEP